MDVSFETKQICSWISSGRRQSNGFGELHVSKCIFLVKGWAPFRYQPTNCTNASNFLKSLMTLLSQLPKWLVLLFPIGNQLSHLFKGQLPILYLDFCFCFCWWAYTLIFAYKEEEEEEERTFYLYSVKHNLYIVASWVI